MTKQVPQSYTINKWLFSPAQHTLTLEESVVELTPLQSGVMQVLIEHAPALVSAKELLEILDEHAQGNRNKLYQSIAKFRRVFDDSSHNAQYIETVARKGYRLIPKPELVEESQQQEIQATRIDEVEVHSGVLEQNIFDDLGFIEHQEQSPQQDEAEAAAEVEAEKADATDILDSIEDPELPAQHQAAATPVSDDSSDSKGKYLKVLVAAIIVLMLIIIYWLSADESVEPVAAAPEIIFVKPIQFTQIDDASEASIANMNWWVTQKLQHLPMIKVKEAKSDNQYPLIEPSIQFNDSALNSLTVDYWLSAKQQQATRLTLPIASEINLKTKLQYQVFNQQLVSMIIQSADVELSDDICLGQDFSSPIDSDNQQCLLVLNRQWQEQSQKNTLVLAEQSIDRFPNNSLGFYQASQQSLLLGDKKSALKYVVSAIERNTNEPQQLMLLSELYRESGQFALSLKLTKLLTDLAPNNTQYQYWLSYDLVSLGFRQRAIESMEKHEISLTNVQDILYFQPLNYNVIKNWLGQEGKLTQEQRALVIAALKDSSFKTSLQQEKRLKAINELKNKRNERIDSRWQLASMYLANNQIEMAKATVEEDEQTSHFIDTFSLDSDDRIFYLPSYANVLLQLNQTDLAKRILQRFILLAQADGHSTTWTLTLAEAYALDNQPAMALAQLSKLLATGWLPHPEQQLWTLRNNPNFSSLKEQWEFINLLELIENRQKLMLMELDATEQ